jgi:cytochrome c oxidase subunit 1
MLAICGVSGVIAIVGGAMYIVITVGTLLFGKRLDVGSYTTTISPLRLPVQAALTGHGGHGGGFAAPGTFVFAMVFLVAFVLYYFVNWKYLSTVWGLS